MAVTTALPREDSSEDVRWQHQPALDGLRTLAVYVVVAFHGGLELARGGFIGVDLFFVLSGFLVTSVLLDGRAGHGRVDLARFYARRVKRLLPAAATCIVVTSTAYALVAPAAARDTVLGGARAAFLYVANWHFLGAATDYFAAEDDPSPFLHFWSLAIEEQFYVVFPLVVIGALALARRVGRPGLVLTATFGGLLTVSLVRQVVVAAAGDEQRAYYATDARLYQLLAGATLASLLWHVPAVRARWPVPAWSAVLALAGFVVAASSWWDASVSTRGLAATAVSVVLVGSLSVDRDSALARLLSRPMATYLGRISYGTYLWHWPIIVLTGLVVTVSAEVMTVLAAVGATSVASLSHRLVEAPVRTAPALAKRHRSVLAVGAVLSLVGGLVLVPATLSSRRPPSVQPVETGVPEAAAVTADFADADVPEGLAWEEARADIPPAPECLGRPVEDCVLVRGSGPRVHLVGDSHARTMLPMFTRLAEEHGFTFSATVGTFCPWQRDLYYVNDSIGPRERCLEQKRDWYERVIPELSPDVVVLFHRAFDDPALPTPMASTDPALAGLGQAALVRASAESTIEQLRAEGRRLAVIEPLPIAPFDTAVCLSGARHLSDCTFEAVEGPTTTEIVYRYADLAWPDVSAIDMDDIVCPDLPFCVPVVDGTVVRRDRHHLAGGFTTSVADAVHARLLRLGVLDPAPA